MGRFLPFRNPGFGNFWVARLVSYFGSAVTVAALDLYVYESEGTGVAVGLLLLVETLPRLFGPFAGALADRAYRRRFMILCDLGQAVLIGSVALTLPRRGTGIRGGWSPGGAHLAPRRLRHRGLRHARGDAPRVAAPAAPFR
jgi:MFS family permease